MLTGTFEQIADTFVLAVWPFYGLAVAGLYRFDAARICLVPYRVPGYPIVPAIFIAACVYLVVSALIGDPLWTGVTLGVVLAGVPVYYVVFARSGTTEAVGVQSSNRPRRRGLREGGFMRTCTITLSILFTPSRCARR